MAYISKEKIAERRKQYWALQGQLAPIEHVLVKFFETNYLLKKGYVPTVDECVRYLQRKSPRTNHMSVNYYLSRRPVQKALEKRGIPWQHVSQTELTNEQVAAAVTVMNFADTRSNDQKLAQLGVNPSQYYAWLNNPQFKNLVDSLADSNLQNIRPTAIAEFTKLINKGDWQAIKYWMDSTGEIRSSDAPQAETLMRFLIEIIQEEVKDPEVLQRIAAKIQIATAARSLTGTFSEGTETWTNETPDAEAVRDARKQLGV